MILVTFPPSDRRLVWYLSLEEYLAGRIRSILPEGERELFFLWRVPPTVIFGRNQVMEAEVNLDYCRSNGIELYRRKSGGGCVYSDMGNVMYSYVSDGVDVESIFSGVIGRLSEVLRSLGVDAVPSGRNDILVGGRKVSGNAFFLLPGSSIVHGTLLFDSDIDEMERAITPSGAKIFAKGVSSVRQHVANLSEFLPGMTVDAFIGHVRDSLASGTYALSEEDIRSVDRIEASYLDPAFIEGKSRRYLRERTFRCEGAGDVTVSLAVSEGEVRAVSLTGDFFACGEKDPSEALESRLLGVEDREDAVQSALDGFILENYVRGLGTSTLITQLYH